MRVACCTVVFFTSMGRTSRCGRPSNGKHTQLSFHTHGLQSCGSGRLVPFLLCLFVTKQTWQK